MHEIDLRRIDLNLLVVFDVLMAERSVTVAAERLNRSQSAISHALGRLREQVNDPLLVKVGARMRPSPFAEHLIEEVRPILASIRRVLVPPETFVPATTAREFRVAIPDLNDTLFPLLAERVRREAPSAGLEWVVRDAGVLLAVAEGHVDVALVPAAQTLPEGLSHAMLKPLRWASFVRKRHPAIATWGRATWTKWPHVAVRVSSRIASPVDSATSELDGRRQITTWVPHFSAVAPLLARTDLIATLPMIVMMNSIERFRLQVLKSPVSVPPMLHRLVWSRRLDSDPALRWFRGHVEQVFRETLDAADAAAPG